MLLMKVAHVGTEGIVCVLLTSTKPAFPPPDGECLIESQSGFDFAPREGPKHFGTLVLLAIVGEKLLA
jgi:hypothetical protein